MPNEAARAIIEKALSSKEAYDEMARQEAAVWGKSGRHRSGYWFSRKLSNAQASLSL